MMSGIIWFIQICHYPLLGLVAKGDVPAYIYRNRVLTAYIVSPIMTVEIITAWLLVFMPYIHVTLGIRIAGVAIVTLVWCSTLFVQLPTNLKLQRDWNEKTFRHLLRTNWIRTIGWSLRVLIAIDIIRQLSFF